MYPNIKRSPLSQGILRGGSRSVRRAEVIHLKCDASAMKP
jgi:hypothetical protein